MRVLGEHRQQIEATSARALDDLIDAHEARMLAELDMYNDPDAPRVAAVHDCSGSRVVSARPAWAPDRDHGKLSMHFTVERSNVLHRAVVCMTLSDDREET